MDWYRMIRPSWQGLFTALLFSSMALGVRLIFMPNLGNYAPYLTFYPVIIITALYRGLFAGVLATLLSAFWTSFFFIEPVGQPFVIQSTNDILAMGIFIFSCLVISGVCEVMHYNRRRVRERTLELGIANQEITEILESITDAFFVLDDNLCFVYSNGEGNRMFGLSQEELLGRSILSFYAGQQLGEYQAAYLQAVKGKCIFHGEIMGIINQDSCYEVQVYPKNSHGVSIYARDVTEKRKVQALNSSLEILVMERTQELQDMNATLEEEVMERQTAQESLGLLATDLEQRVVERTQDLQDLNAVLEEEVMEREATQRAMQEEKERYEALLQQSAEAVALIDLDLKKVVEINEAFSKMFGYSMEQLSNTAITDLGLLSRHEVESISDLLMQDEILHATIRYYQSNAGRSIQAERTGSFIRHGGKRLLMLSYDDVTEERKLQATIQEQLELAAEVQKSMLPSDYQDGRLIVHTIFEPLMLVSGDFYGYRWSPDGQRLNGYLIDVTGHGVATSLYSSAASSLLNEALSDGQAWTMAKVSWINQRLAQYLNDTTFVALIVFTFDFENKILTCIAGGINYILVSTKKQRDVVAIPGIYLGVTEEPKFGLHTMKFQKGDNFYLMTDGIYEKLPREAIENAQEFIDTVAGLRSIARGKSHDDCSALCFHIAGIKALPIVLDFPSQGEKTQVRCQISQILSELTGQKQPKIQVALGEAIANSLRYGTEVRIKINKIGQRLILRVRSDGFGFDGNAVVAENSLLGLDQVFGTLLDQEGGRGIPIMMLWSDKVLYNQKGNEVMLISNL